MDWLQVRIELGRLNPAPVEAALLQLGAAAIEYRDAGDEPILEPAPGTTPLWQEVCLSALLDPATPPDQVRQWVSLAVAPANAPPMEFSSLADRDWVGDFRAALKPMRFGDGLWLLPTDASAPADARAVVRLEPGLAFGSGRHPTTALCLEWLARLDCAGRVLDFGCGSGVLAMAAVLLGAREAWAVDIDPQALDACARNAATNGVADRVLIAAPEELAPDLKVDALVANILSGTLIELAPILCARLRTGAEIALSGILPSQADAVRQRFSPWIEFAAQQQQGEWILLAGRARETRPTD
ncbi:MAG: 50S ribosomal protein L11 methyltransferase [Gammaproteobacteria bacterium]